MWERAVTDLCLTATAVVPAGVVIVVLHLVVGVAVVVIVCHPMEAGMIVEVGLSYSGQR